MCALSRFDKKSFRCVAFEGERGGWVSLIKERDGRVDEEVRGFREVDAL